MLIYSFHKSLVALESKRGHVNQKVVTLASTIFLKLWLNEYMSIYPYWIALNYVSIWAFQHFVPVYSPKNIKRKFCPNGLRTVTVLALGASPHGDGVPSVGPYIKSILKSFNVFVMNHPFKNLKFSIHIFLQYFRVQIFCVALPWR